MVTYPIQERLEALADRLTHIVEATQNHHSIHLVSDLCPDIVVVEIRLHNVRHVTKRNDIDLGVVVDELRHHLLKDILDVLSVIGILRNSVRLRIVVPAPVDQAAARNLVTRKVGEPLLALGPPEEAAGVGEDDAGRGVVGSGGLLLLESLDNVRH